MLFRSCSAGTSGPQAHHVWGLERLSQPSLDPKEAGSVYLEQDPCVVNVWPGMVNVWSLVRGGWCVVTGHGRASVWSLVRRWSLCGQGWLVCDH